MKKQCQFLTTKYYHKSFHFYQKYTNNKKKFGQCMMGIFSSSLAVTFFDKIFPFFDIPIETGITNSYTEYTGHRTSSVQISMIVCLFENRVFDSHSHPGCQCSVFRCKKYRKIKLAIAFTHNVRYYIATENAHRAYTERRPCIYEIYFKRSKKR